MKKAAFITTLALAGCHATGEKSSLEDYRWENRVIIHHNAPSELLKLGESEQAGFQDRDLVFLPANEDLQKQFNLTGPNAVFVLIGKDGGEKARQADALDLQKWFQLIDSMPMRQREMKE